MKKEITKRPKYYIGVGLCFGVVFGVVFDNIGLGVVLGLIFGAAFQSNVNKKRSKNKEHPLKN